MPIMPTKPCTLSTLRIFGIILLLVFVGDGSLFSVYAAQPNITDNSYHQPAPEPEAGSQNRSKLPVDLESIDLETIRLQLKWYHQFQFAGYYAAIQKGFYREAGLDVQLSQYRPRLDIVEQVTNGSAQYGVAGSDILLHRLQGRPVVVLAALFQHSPVVVFSRKDLGMATPHGLIGRRLMWEPVLESAIPAMLMYEGISIEQLDIVKPSHNHLDLLNGKTDAMAGYITNRPYFLKKMGVELNVIHPHQYGANFYGDCLFTSETEISRHPQRVERFRQASLKGWEYALNNPVEIVDLILKRYGSKRTRDHLLYEAAVMNDLIMPNIVQIGHMNPGRWLQIAKLYHDLGKIQGNYMLDGFLYSRDTHPDWDWLRWVLGGIVLVALIALGFALTQVAFNRRLKRSVARRTLALSDANALLTKEITDKERAEAELTWEAKIDAALSELYKPLVSPDSTIDSITAIILEQAQQLTGSVYGYVSSIDPLSGDTVGHTLTEMLGSQCRVQTQNGGQTIAFPCGEDGRYGGLWGHVLNSRRAFYTNSPANHPAATGLPQGHVPLHNFLTVPVMMSEEAVGQIALANKPTDFEQRDLEAVVRLAEYYALAIQRLRAEQALDASRESFHNIVERSDDGFIVLQDERIVRYVNAAAARLLDRQPDLLLQRPFEFPVTPSEGGSRTTELDFPRSDGSPRILEVHRVDTHWEGRPASLVTLRDITAQKKTHVEKMNLERQLVNSQKMEAIGTLAGGIAHDFNNILMAISGYTEISLLKSGKKSGITANLEEILKASERATDLVRQILTFSRQSEKELRPVHLKLIVKEVLKLLRATLPSSIAIRQDINSDAHIDADPTQIHQILMNLCTNAAHAMSTKGDSLAVGLTELDSEAVPNSVAAELQPGRYVKLTVSDNGCGMTKSVRDRIFDPFFTTKERGKGTGMGLAVVHGIVKSHNGTIIANSRPDRGSTFEIYFPAITRNTQKADNRRCELARGSEHILIVDDEAALANLTHTILRRLGYNVTVETSSTTALKRFKSEPASFDLLITDMTMPQITGDKLARKILKIRPDLPIILCTGYHEQISEEKALRLGVKDFILKPVTVHDLARIVRRALDESSCSREVPKNVVPEPVRLSSTA